MKIKDLLKEIEIQKVEYGKDFLEWDIYTEQLKNRDKKCKRTGEQKGWGIVNAADGWEYFECAGFNTVMPKEKIFTVNVNY